jgi:hypothetical protein
MIGLVEPDAAKRRAAREYDAERVDPRPDVEGVPSLLKVHASDNVSVTPGPNSIDREASCGIGVGGDRISFVMGYKKDRRETDAPSGRRISDIADQHSTSSLHTRGNDGKCQRCSFRRNLAERMTFLDRR